MKMTVALSYENFNHVLAERFDGVGLVRSEYIFRSIEKYPSDDTVRQHVVPYLLDISQLTTSVVWYRTLEVDTAEANVLSGVEEIIIEPDRLLGLRGIRRSHRYPDAFRAELRGIAEVRRVAPNVGVVLPFVTYAEEVRWAKEEVDKFCPGTPLGVMIETPASLLEIDKILPLGVNRVQIGCNDLSSLLLARPRTVRGPVKAEPPLVRAIELMRNATADSGVELAVAGYLDNSLIRACQVIGVDECVIHYSDIPDILGEEWRKLLPEVGKISDIKRKTREAIREFAEIRKVDLRIY